MDLNKIAASFYNIAKQINNAAVETVGIDVLWARAIPYENSEDVIIQEYTLHSVECPRKLRVVTNKTDYDPGVFNVELFGITYEQPFEIMVDIKRWEAEYGKGTMPQKDDIVYVQILHRLYEVKSSTVVCSVAEMPIGYKVVLGKYIPTASRKENEDLKESIQDLTVSQAELFGEAISKEIADITDPIDFDMHNTDVMDTLKVCEYESIIHDEFVVDSNIISEAYYNFTNTTKPIEYNMDCTYYKTGKNNVWLYTCWLKRNESTETKPIHNLSLYTKNKLYYTFKIKSDVDFEIGDEVTIKRGELLSVTGTITEKHNNQYMLNIPVNMVLRTNKKLTDWWNTTGWIIDQSTKFNLIKGYTDGTATFDINLADDLLSIKFNNMNKTIKLDSDNFLKTSKWYYLAVCITQKTIKLYIRTINKSKNKIVSSLLCSKTLQFGETINTYSVEKFEIDNTGKNVQLRNIRLYEDQYIPTDEQLLLDSQSRYPANASKMIISDMPNIENDMRYISASK